VWAVVVHQDGNCGSGCVVCRDEGWGGTGIAQAEVGAGGLEGWEPVALFVEAREVSHLTL